MRDLAIILVTITVASITWAAGPLDAEAPTYALRLFLPADAVPTGSPVPVVIEVTNESHKPLLFRNRVLSTTVDESQSLKLPDGACVILLVRPLGERAGGAGGSSRSPVAKEVTVEPGESGLVPGEVSQKDLRSPVFALRAILMLDGKQVAASPWSEVSLRR